MLGPVASAGDNLILARFTTTGAVDQGFGDDGVFSVPVGDGAGGAASLIVQKDAKLLVLGTTNKECCSDRFYLARLTRDGGFDSTFDGGLITGNLADLDSYNERRAAWALVLQLDGKLVFVVAGDDSNGQFRTRLVRYKPAGTQDLTFGGQGVVSPPFLVNAIVVQPSDGKLVVVGKSWNGTDFDFALARYRLNGTLDPNFGGGDGIVTTKLGSGDDSAEHVVIVNGQFVVAGKSFNGTDFDSLLVRYTSSGAVNLSFGSDGIVRAPISINALTVQPNGRVVAAGKPTSSSGMSGFALARFLP